MRMCPNAIHLSLRDFTLRTKTARNSVEIAVKTVRQFSIIQRKPLHKTLFKINICLITVELPFYGHPFTEAGKVHTLSLLSERLYHGHLSASAKTTK